MPGTYRSPTETGFYYLNARYYDPALGRFLNPDDYVSTGQGLTDFNMYAYCGNNPISNIDPSGNSFISTIISTVKKLINYRRKINKIKEYMDFISLEPSDEMIALLKNYETLRSERGPDDTIGYGHSIQSANDPYYNRSSITQEEAESLLASDLSNIGQHVKKYANQRHIILTQHQYDAYVLYGYNAGYARVPDVMDLIDSGTPVYDAFCYRYDKQYDNTKLGLYRRWCDSADIYLYGEYRRDYR